MKSSLGLKTSSLAFKVSSNCRKTKSYRAAALNADVVPTYLTLSCVSFLS